MSGKTAISVAELSILLAIAVLIAAISAPSLVRNRKKKQAAVCAVNLEILSAAAQRHADDTGSWPKSLDSLVPTHLEILPACPAGCVYSPGTSASNPPTCSVHGLPF